MFGFLIFMIVVILAIACWRIFLPLAIVAAIGFGSLLLYFEHEDSVRDAKYRSAGACGSAFEDRIPQGVAFR
jgi:hypothetical protein